MLAVGDNYNDREMLESVGSSVAMKSGKEGIRKMCRYETDLVEDLLKEILEENMIKLIASDIDGTLLVEGSDALNPEIFQVIRGLKEKT